MSLKAKRNEKLPENDGNRYVKLVDEMLTKAIQQRASDIHLEPFRDGARIRVRIDGVLQTQTMIDKACQMGMTTRIKVMARMNITEKRLPQDGKFMLPDHQMDVRVSSIPDIRGEKLVLRLLSSQRNIADIQKLGLTASQMNLVQEMISRKRGLILVCGPTGCGKSTTLYAMIRQLSGSEVNITTIEDPVEITMEGITQIQLQEAIGLTYGEVLKATMRQDPDIIMVGEIRDQKVATEAIRFAMTGHQVLTTLHTVDAFGSIKRLLEMGTESYLLADVLEGVIAQRLVRRLCPHCKKAFQSGQPEARLWQIPEGSPLYRPTGCPHCGNTGYYGRIGVFEILVMDESIREGIVTGKKTGHLTVEKGHFIPFGWSIRNLMLQGITAPEEGVRVFGTEKRAIKDTEITHS